jgi:hypothetical protein
VVIVHSIRIDKIASRGVGAEGIVGKWTGGTYRTDGRSTSWLKIKNSAQSQIAARSEFFERERAHTQKRGASQRPVFV